MWTSPLRRELDRLDRELETVAADLIRRGECMNIVDATVRARDIVQRRRQSEYQREALELSRRRSATIPLRQPQ